jgi:hypothetical protein
MGHCLAKNHAGCHGRNAVQPIGSGIKGTGFTEC